jgi:hypothetical protein
MLWCRSTNQRRDSFLAPTPIQIGVCYSHGFEFRASSFGERPRPAWRSRLLDCPRRRLPLAWCFSSNTRKDDAQLLACDFLASVQSPYGQLARKRKRLVTPLPKVPPACHRQRPMRWRRG